LTAKKRRKIGDIDKINKSKTWTLIKSAPGFVSILPSLGLILKAAIKKRGRPEKTL